jgi:hypothetical protein
LHLLGKEDEKGEDHGSCCREEDEEQQTSKEINWEDEEQRRPKIMGRALVFLHQFPFLAEIVRVEASAVVEIMVKRTCSVRR